MSDTADALRAKLIRNFNDVALVRQQRDPLYDTLGASVSAGTAAAKLGIGIDVLPPGKRGCPYHLHHVQEEMFIVLEGEGTLRVAGEMLPVKAGDVVVIPPGPLPAPVHQHLRCADEVPEHQHQGAAGDLRIPRLRQVPGPGHRLRRRAAQGGVAGLLGWRGLTSAAPIPRPGALFEPSVG
jgi:mannose-6-phosphate isomerase-like protein (cupin superfamily)